VKQTRDSGGYLTNYDKVIELKMPRDFLPAQLEVLDLIKYKKATLYSGAFRAGKTLLLVHASIMTCLKHPGAKGILLSQVSSQVKSAVFDLFLEELKLYQKQLDDAGIKLKLTKKELHSSGSLEVEFYNGSRVLFRSCKTKKEQRKYASITFDFFGLDEPVDMDEEVFDQLIGRISGTGNVSNMFGLLTTNPGSELHWLYQNFYPPEGHSKYNPEFAYVETSTRDNYLLPDYKGYIRSCELKWDRDWVLRYLDGKWGMFSGQIFKEYNPKIHVQDVKDIPVKYKILAVDWGLRDPYCILVGGVTNDNRLLILEEYYSKKTTSHELSKMIAKLHSQHYFRKGYIDPSAADLILQCYQRGVPCGSRRNNGDIRSLSNNDVTFTISRLQTLFKHNMILIDKSCHNLRKQIPSYRYEEGTDKPRKENDHAVDALRYLVTDFDPLHKDSWFDVIYYRVNKWG